MNDGCAMMVSAYKLTLGADCCIHPTVAAIFRLIKTRIKLIGKNKKLSESEI